MARSRLVAGVYEFTLNSDDGARLWLDDVLVADQWAMGAGQALTVSVSNGRGAGAVVPIRIEMREIGGAASLSLTWTPPGQTAAAVPASALSPGYNLLTSSTEPDAAPANPGAVTTQTTTTSYGSKPWEGLAQAVAVDPAGLALTSQTRYDSWQRRTASALPAGDVDDPAARSSDVYYAEKTATAAAETADNPCTPAVEALNQAGRRKTTTGPSGADGRTLIRQAVYDLAGRVLASRTRSRAADGSYAADAEGWTCTSYDARGRVTAVAYPGYGAQPARNVTTTYALGGNPLVSQVSDPAGTITTTVDLLGRVITYTDVHGLTTTTDYDQAGRVVAVTTRAGGGVVLSGQVFGYDSGGRLASQSLNGTLLAAPGYDSASGELAGVDYQAAGAGGTHGTLSRDPNGRVTGLVWALPAGTIRDTVTRSQAGGLLTDTVTATVPGVIAPRPSGYGYDAAGRLVSATVPGHRLGYSFDPAGGCGANPAAGKNTNRTGLTDTPLDAAGVVSGASVSTTYCYDRADRLTAVSGGAGSAGGPDASPGYDSHGNTTAVGGQTFGYDAANRHLTSSVGGADPAAVTYTRDATDRIVARASSAAGDAGSLRYGHTGDGDTADLTLDAAGNPLEQHLVLPGGVVFTHRFTGTGSGAGSWAYPNVHGDLIVATDAAGALIGGLRAYDPYGQPINLATGAIGQAGSPAADDTVPDTRTGDLDDGWLGQHQRGYEHAGALALINMGARPCSGPVSRISCSAPGLRLRPPN